MSRVTFRRESAPVGALFRDYGVTPEEVTFVWQIRAPRVERGVPCWEAVTEGIVYGGGPRKATKLIPYSDDGVPPATPGYYCAGRLYTGGRLVWVMRSTIERVNSRSRREEDASVTALDSPSVYPLQSLKHLLSNFNGKSKAGTSVAGFARQHWDAVGRLGPMGIGCTVREVEYAMWSEEETGGWEYQLEAMRDPGAKDFDGELCGVLYSASAASDLTQHTAHLVMRSRVASAPIAPIPARPAVPPPPQGQKSGFGAGSSGAGGSGAGALVALAALGALAWNRRKHGRK